MQDGLPPIIRASNPGHHDTVETHDSSAHTASSSFDILFSPSHLQHHETLEVLLHHKADVNAKDKVRRGEGCEGAPMGARRPWNGLGPGLCYELMMMSEG